MAFINNQRGYDALNVLVVSIFGGWWELEGRGVETQRGYDALTILVADN